jgi:hypothetical protein
MGMAESIMNAKKIKNADDLAKVTKMIENAIWRDESGKVCFGTIDICDHCKTPFHINTVTVTQGPRSLFAGLESINLEECTCDPDNDYKCMFCD